MIEVNEIRNSSKFLKISYDEENKILSVDSDLNPNVIDNNFNELDERLKNLENKVNKIMFNYTEL